MIEKVSGIFLSIFYLGSIALHLYTTWLAFLIQGFIGAFAAFSLPGISELFIFVMFGGEFGWMSGYCLLIYAWLAVGAVAIIGVSMSKSE